MCILSRASAFRPLPRNYRRAFRCLSRMPAKCILGFCGLIPSPKYAL